MQIQKLPEVLARAAGRTDGLTGRAIAAKAAQLVIRFRAFACVDRAIFKRFFGKVRRSKPRRDFELNRVLEVQTLEARVLLSAVGSDQIATPAHISFHQSGTAHTLATAGPTGSTPTQVRHAYGFDNIKFNGGAVAGDGSGTTIAIVDAYDDPNIAADLQQFDVKFGLPDPIFTKVDQTGGTNYPAPNSGWITEIALDVEWAHAIAPAANILLVEGNTANWSDLNAAVGYAANASGVVAVSMSWGGGEFSGETALDGGFTTPVGHAGVTFVAASGDSGAPPMYPATSPNVLSVGGTTLKMDAAGNWLSETAWSGSGGGISGFESQPAYQNGVVTQSTSMRTNPDVSYDANPSTGFPVYDSYNNGTTTPWGQWGGTSDAAPQWSALIAIADQGRALAGNGPLDGPAQTLPMLYSMPASDFLDITSGASNGKPNYSAAAGYDLVTGRGSPIADLVVNDLGGAVTTFLTDTTPVKAYSVVEGNSTGSRALATFTDSNPNAALSDFSAPSVNWGGTVVGTPAATVQLVSRTSVSNWQVVGSPTYAEKGSYTVAVSVTTQEGLTDQTSNTSFTVAEGALIDTTPVATLHAVEGNSTGNVVLATFTDANPLAPSSDYTLGVNWGGPLVGVPSTAIQFVSQSGTLSTWQVVGSAVYANVGTYTVSVTVADADGAALYSRRTKLAVAAAPLINTTTASTFNEVEGNTAGPIILATFTDGNPNATLPSFTDIVNWGGSLIGSPAAAVQLVSRTANASYWQLQASPTYAEKGGYTPLVTIKNSDGATFQSNAESFIVADAALTDSTPVAALNAVEGTSTGSVVIAAFTDGNPSAPTGDFAANVNWGGTVIGTPTYSIKWVSRTASVSTWRVVGTVTYAEKGTYVVNVTVGDADGSSVQTSNTSFNVADGALTDSTTARALGAVEGISTGTVVLATFTDGNPQAPPADFTAAVDWGGTLIGAPTFAVQLVSQSSRSSIWQVVGSATYAEKGTYTVTVTFGDVDGNSVKTTRTSFKVADGALTDTTPTTTYNAVHGSNTGTVVLATFTDANPYAPPSDFNFNVNWGGALVGTPTLSLQLVSTSSSGSVWEVLGSATYLNSGIFAVTVTLTDLDGNTLTSKKTTFIVT